MNLQRLCRGILLGFSIAMLARIACPQTAPGLSTMVGDLVIGLLAMGAISATKEPPPT
jgi:hypothetical protein